MPLKRVFDKIFLGGVNIGSTYAKGGSGIAYRVSTRGEGGSKKAEKLRTYYVHVPIAQRVMSDNCLMKRQTNKFFRSPQL